MTRSKVRFKIRKPKDVFIGFRVTSAEKQQLDEQCAGIALSDYIRAKVLDQSVPRSRAKLLVPKSLREIRYELREIGNNLNQPTRAINEALKTQLCPMTDQTAEYLATLDQALELIRQTCLEIEKLGLAICEACSTREPNLGC